MNRFIIYCTEEQTKKAFKLGAPISYGCGMSDLINKKYYFDNKGNFVIIPTAEEMIGWLEEQNCFIEIGKSFITDYQSLVHNGKETVVYNEFLPSRKEATITAIDVALDYLINEKK